MSPGTYYKLRRENQELKDKIALLENGFSDKATEENILKAPDSFIELLNDYQNRGKLSLEQRADNLKDDIISDVLWYDTPVTMILSKGKIVKTELTSPQWEYLKILGNGDPSVGFSVLVAMYKRKKE